MSLDMGKTENQSGEMNVLLIPLILVSVVALAMLGFGGWAYLQYADARDNVQGKIDIAVSEARKDQQAEDAKVAAERRKEPYETFVGPDELGRVEFKYPKTWSVYVSNDGDGGNFQAVLQPQVVHPLDANRPYALRVTIEPRSYESVINDYQSKVEEGLLRSDAVVINGFNGIRLSGNFSDSVQNGQTIVFKVRDKTLSLSTEAQQYFADYKNIILETFRFNP